MPKYCNICSTKMFPLPHLQTPGNMWAARCGHVAKLKNLQNFDQDMLKVQDAERTKLGVSTGNGRYAEEHCIHIQQLHLELKKTPRFELQAYRLPGRFKAGARLCRDMAEYRILYDTEPSADWWGCTFFKRS